MRLLILEDNQERIEKFKKLFKNQDLYIAEDIQRVKEHCSYNEFSVIFLDHDLGNKMWVNSDEENTGYQFVKWMVDSNLQRNALIYIHSMNPIGANKMLNYLLDNGYDGIWHPFHLLKLED